MALGVLHLLSSYAYPLRVTTFIGSLARNDVYRLDVSSLPRENRSRALTILLLTHLRHSHVATQCQQ
ncbi:MAG TPA: hypothetical protein VM822_00800 [Pseudolabrys sp.]|jgi:hypothetical protein|nr:hypothetical protein [Pseudolabrys sp.]